MRAFVASAVAVILFGGWMLLAGRGAPGVWIPIIGIAFVSSMIDAHAGHGASAGRRA